MIFAWGIEAKNFTLAVNRAEGTRYWKFIELIYQEVLGTIGLSPKFEYHPLKRSSLVANSGNVDAEPGRVFEYQKLYENLIRVDEPIWEMKVVAYTWDKRIKKVLSWNSLPRDGYIIGYPYGMVICEKNLNDRIDSNFLIKSSDTFEGLRRTSVKRIDIFVDDLYSLKGAWNQLSDLEGSKLVRLGVVDKVNLYMYVHKKHRALIPKLIQSIKEMKSKGKVKAFEKLCFES